MVLCTGMTNYAEALVCVQIPQERSITARDIFSQPEPADRGADGEAPAPSSRKVESIWVDSHGTTGFTCLLPRITLGDKDGVAYSEILHSAWKCYQTNGFNDLRHRDLMAPPKDEGVSGPLDEGRRAAINKLKLTPYDKGQVVARAVLKYLIVYLFSDEKGHVCCWDGHGNNDIIKLSKTPVQNIKIVFKPDGITVEKQITPSEEGGYCSLQ